MSTLELKLARIPTCIFAGGLGTRLSEQTTVKPKPMVEIGGMPVLWHIMKYYSSFGFHDFKVALGYKGDYIKNYFLNYRYMKGDLSLNFETGEIEADTRELEPWKIDLMDTGLETMTGGRLRRMCEKIGNGIFFLTYGDGVSDVNLHDLLSFHLSHNKLVTVTAVRPPARFGSMDIDGSAVKSFQEKPQIGEGWINGGFFVVDARVIDYLTDDQTPFEKDPLTQLAEDGELMAFKHHGFWHCMDTQRDVASLEELWARGKAPWKVWGNTHAAPSPAQGTTINVLE
jgi:glucose-1-phosphate cytidylyltransferase